MNKRSDKQSKSSLPKEQKSKTKQPTAKPASSALGGAVPMGMSEAGLEQKVLQRLPLVQQQNLLQQMNRVHGNQQANRIIDVLQRHPGHSGGHNLNEAQEEEVSRTVNHVMRWSEGVAQRAALIPETTSLATIKAGAAPATLMDGTGAGASNLGSLAVGDQIRILENPGGATVRVHVEMGNLAGKIGHIPSNSFNVTANPTSLRTPLVGTENAYAQLITEINKANPDRDRIFGILELRMTADQQSRLTQPANAEFNQLKGLRVIRSQDLLRIMSILGLPLKRQLTEYLAKRGRNVEATRQMFATANDDERLAVAQDDALMSRVRRILSGVHPEIVFGTTLSTLYPADGSLKTLKGTHPNLAHWLRQHTRSRDINMAAQERAAGLQGALIQVNTQGAAKTRGMVMEAVRAAPRGAALPSPERTALDQIVEAAYNASNYTSSDLGAIFITRWGRPFRGASSRPKTFLYRLYQALKQMPEDLVLFTNTLERIGENTDPSAAGSFTDWLGSANFGTIVADRPGAMEPLHAATAQNRRTITVNEPYVDLYQRGLQVQVTQADGSQLNATVRSVNARQRQVRLSQKVNVAAGGELNPNPNLNQTWQDFAGGAALRVTSAAALFADNAGSPNLGSQLGLMQAGYTVAELGRQTVAGTDYVHCRVYEGALRQQEGWVEAAKVSSLGGQTVAQADFDQTMRHEMGHALDLQLGGFSNFSAPSKAQWRKYTGVNNWVTDLINTAGIANPTTNQTFNGVTTSFQQAARTYSQAVQDDNAGAAPALRAQQWLQGWVATGGGSQPVVDTVTQFGATPNYYNVGGQGLPPLNGRIFGAHYGEWFSANDNARTDSLSKGVSPYAYTCTYEFFADHYAAYTGPGVPPEQYARAVPEWVLNYFDRLVGVANAGPRIGLARRQMGP